MIPLCVKLFINNKNNKNTQFYEHFVSLLTNHLNKRLSIAIPADKETRDKLNTTKLESLAEIEKEVAAMIVDLIESNTPAEDVYSSVKSEIDYQVNLVQTKLLRASKRRA